ncbi:MAG: hypothetical protein NTU62_16975 [Spirochaetes bacterium]|jgi:hypothetical protein|nr:hypothetical protein [Spirochaetota bacterium]
MKLNAKTLSSLALLCMLGMLVGGLAWEVLERVALRSGLDVDLSIGPVGFDLSVVALSVTVNPGTFLGLVAAVLLFRAL